MDYIIICVSIAQTVTIAYLLHIVRQRTAERDVAEGILKTAVPARQARIGMALIADAEATLVKPRETELQAAMAAGGAACMRGWGERLVAGADGATVSSPL